MAKKNKFLRNFIGKIEGIHDVSGVKNKEVVEESSRGNEGEGETEVVVPEQVTVEDVEVEELELKRRKKWKGLAEARFGKDSFDVVVEREFAVGGFRGSQVRGGEEELCRTYG